MYRVYTYMSRVKTCTQKQKPKYNTNDMPYQTLTEKSKATTEPWFNRLLRPPARIRSRTILGYTHIYLLALDPRREPRPSNSAAHCPILLTYNV